MVATEFVQQIRYGGLYFIEKRSVNKDTDVNSAMKKLR